MTFAPNADGQETDDFSRAALVRRMRQAENQVHSAEARFEEIKLPTPANMIPLIKELCQKEGNPVGAAGYIIDKETAQAAGRKVHWRRLGEKERIDSTPLEADKENLGPQIRASNGEFVRWILPGADRTRAAIQTVEGGHWKTENRLHPFSMIFEYQDMPYSEIVARSPSYQSGVEFIGGRKYHTVQFQHPDIAGTSFQLLFDHRLRLFERRLLWQNQKDKPAHIGETHRFSEWELFENKTGEPVELPSVAVYKYFLGAHPNGTLVEYAQTELEITDLVLNLPLSDALFLPEIPVQAEVFDGISGMGTLPPGKRPDHLFPEDVESRWWWIKLLGVGLLTGVLGGLVALRRYQSAAGA